VARSSLDAKPLQLSRLTEWIKLGRLDISQPITLKELHSSGCIKGIDEGGVKLLGDVRVLGPPRVRKVISL
jgi:large subunit ribosomal protein L15